MTDAAGKVLGWIGIVIGVIGFFFAHIWLGIIALVLGLVTLASPQKSLGWIGIVIGIIVLLVFWLF